MGEGGRGNAKSKGSPHKINEHKSGIKFNSFVYRKPSELHKLMPKSPSKSVAVLKHIWDQLYRENRTKPCIHKYWNVNQKEMCSIMLKLGKHQAGKDICKINKLVSDIKCKY